MLITFLVFRFANIITSNNQVNGKSDVATDSVLKFQLSNFNGAGKRGEESKCENVFSSRVTKREKCEFDLSSRLAGCRNPLTIIRSSGTSECPPIRFLMHFLCFASHDTLIRARN